MNIATIVRSRDIKVVSVYQDFAGNLTVCGMVGLACHFERSLREIPYKFCLKSTS